MSMTLEQLARSIGATVLGDGSTIVKRCATIDAAGPEDVTFLANAKYVASLHSTRAAAVIVDAKVDCPKHLTRLVADDTYFAFRNAMIALHGFRSHPKPMMLGSGTDGGKRPQRSGIGDGAAIHPSATIGEETTIHPHAVVEAGAVIGRNCVLYPGVYIGEGVKVGDECLLHPNVVIYDHCELGNRVTLHACTVIGQDGFGYATHKGAHHKIPQAGNVVIEDDVEMGGACAIERAAMGETRIGKGTKFADLISIGHGCTIGEHCLFVSLVGVSGSVDVGKYVSLGGQVGVTGHLRIGNFVQVAARSAVVQDVPDGIKVGGVPAIELDKAKRNALVGLELYDLFKRVRQLERELEKMKSAAE
jgi:UDP-3-O-[3-hydroxymyristoyl] glucosamine N-acyltransferase